MSTTAERQAAHRLAQPTNPVTLRTWHGVQILPSAHYGSGLRGFLVGTCPDLPGRVRVLVSATDLVVCCLRLTDLTGAVTLHNRTRCPGDTCTEGDPIDLEEAL